MKVFEHHGAWPKPVEKKNQFSKAKNQSEREEKLPKNQEVSEGKRSNIKKLEGGRVGKKEISAQEIRDKVEMNQVKKGNRPMKAPTQVEAQEGENLKAHVTVTPPEDKELNLNDPQDPATIGKLKDMLGSNAVNFSQKQRDVLEKILADR